MEQTSLATNTQGKSAIFNSKFVAVVFEAYEFICRKVHYSRCDVTKWADQAALFKSAIAKSPSGKIDIVVVNAGISGQDPVYLNPSKPTIQDQGCMTLITEIPTLQPQQKEANPRSRTSRS